MCKLLRPAVFRSSTLRCVFVLVVVVLNKHLSSRRPHTWGMFSVLVMLLKSPRAPSYHHKKVLIAKKVLCKAKSLSTHLAPWWSRTLAASLLPLSAAFIRIRKKWKGKCHCIVRFYKKVEVEKVKMIGVEISPMHHTPCKLIQISFRCQIFEKIAYTISPQITTDFLNQELLQHVQHWKVKALLSFASVLTMLAKNK